MKIRINLYDFDRDTARSFHGVFLEKQEEIVIDVGSIASMRNHYFLPYEKDNERIYDDRNNVLGTMIEMKSGEHILTDITMETIEHYSDTIFLTGMDYVFEEKIDAN